MMIKLYARNKYYIVSDYEAVERNNKLQNNIMYYVVRRDYDTLQEA